MRIEIIPAIDILHGKCVRLLRGDYQQQTVYNEDPVAVAQDFERLGFHRLHVVDLDGARSKHIVNDQVLQAITNHTQLTVDFGGGIKTDADIEKAFAAGAALVTVGSLAITNPDLFMTWLQRYGADHIILGADVRDGKVSINGWTEDSTQELIPFLRQYVDKGVRHVLCTDIKRDGTLTGPSVDLYSKIIEQFPHLDLIASGGISSNDDIRALDRRHIPAVVVGKAWYEGRINLKTLYGK